jgi:predicted AlkP superfamily phosphohydrolase/phosphomutase
MLFLLALFVAGPACRNTPAAEATGAFQRAPILLVGVDGFEWNIALRLLHQGRLPALAGLMRRGSFGLLETIPGRVSPALWTSVATGKVVEKHGIADFLKRQQPPVFFTSRDRKTKAFWNIVSDRGVTVDVVGWFLTYPVEPILGTMVAQSNTPRRSRQGVLKGGLWADVENQVFPPQREAEILAMMADVDKGLDAMIVHDLQTDSKDAPADLRQVVEHCKWSFRADEIYARTALALLQKETPDILAVYLGSTDVVGHRFWPSAAGKPFLPRKLNGDLGSWLAPRMKPGSVLDRVLGSTLWPTLVPDEAQGYSTRVIDQTYERADRAIASLVAAAPANATILVLSDHGFRPWGHGDGPDAFFVAAGTNVRRAEGPAPEQLTHGDLRRVGSIVDITPTLLALSGVPAGLDMDGHVLDSVLTPLPGTTRLPAIATHDTSQWLASHSARPRHGVVPDNGEAERLEQLRALGYIK